MFGVILAGGQGRRMGGVDKALLRLGGQSLIARVAARFAPQVDRLAVSGRQGHLGLPCLPDEDAGDAPDGRGRGPLAGVLAGLCWARTEGADVGADVVVTVPVDAPFVPQDLVRRLLEAAGSAGGLEGGSAGGFGRVVVAQSGGRVHPTFALWPVAVAPALRAFLASGAAPRVQDFARAQGAVLAEFADADAFTNLNTPEDLARAQERA